MPRPRRSAASAAPSYREDDTEEDATSSGDEDGVAGGSSSRRAAAGVRAAGGDGEDDEDTSDASLASSEEDDSESEYDDGDQEPPNKRARRASSSVQRKRYGGRLELFQQIPVDLLCEIASHLDPHSLLRLSRSSKRLRSIFTSKTSKTVWKAARSNVGLPDLRAKDLSEMQYASLVFDRMCMACGHDRAMSVCFFQRCRWCRQCGGNMMRQKPLRKTISKLHPDTFSTFASPSGGAEDPNSQTLYFRPYVIERSNKLRSFKRNSDAFFAFLKKHRILARAASKDAHAIRNWVFEECMNKRDGQDDRRSDRYAAIKARVIALGYAREDLRHIRYNSVVLPLIDQATPLSEKIWSRIKPKLIPFLDEAREERHVRDANERKKVRREALIPFYTATVATLVPGSDKSLMFPPFLYLSEEEPVKSLWEPEGATVDQASWDAAVESLPMEPPALRYRLDLMKAVAAEACRIAEREKYDVCLLPDELIFDVYGLIEEKDEVWRVPPQDFDNLHDYPDIVYRCRESGCTAPGVALSAPEIIVHLRDCLPPEQLRVPDHFFELGRLVERCVAAKQLDMDPRTATDEALDKAGMRFKCESPVGPFYQRGHCPANRMTWSELNAHWHESSAQDTLDHDRRSFSVLPQA
ncbi:hypothetical protein JCM10213_007706 [Rhodosporidiobolus nylandii]